MSTASLTSGEGLVASFAPQTYAITGPNWKGTLPAGVTEYKSPTSIVWLLGRIYCTGTPEEYAAVHALQDQISLVPLSSYGKPYSPPAGRVDPSIDMKIPVRDQVNNLSVGAYFDLLATLMKDNPPADDAAVLVQFRLVDEDPRLREPGLDFFHRQHFIHDGPPVGTDDSGRYWTRTSDHSRVRRTLYH